MILGISHDGYKKALTIKVGENESTKYWLSVLNVLINLGVKDILIICADSPIDIKEAIERHLQRPNINDVSFIRSIIIM